MAYAFGEEKTSEDAVEYPSSQARSWTQDEGCENGGDVAILRSIRPLIGDAVSDRIRVIVSHLVDIGNEWSFDSFFHVLSKLGSMALKLAEAIYYIYVAGATTACAR